MNYHLVHIGFGNMLVAEKIVAIIQPGSAPVRRLKEEARGQGQLIDATQGRKTRSIIVMDSNHIVLSAVQAETIAARYEGEADIEDSADNPETPSPTTD